MSAFFKAVRRHFFTREFLLFLAVKIFAFGRR